MKTTTLFPRITALLLTLILLIAAVPTASAADTDIKDGQISLEVTELEQSDDSASFKLKYNNLCGNQVRIGLKDSNHLKIETDEGVYYTLAACDNMNIGNGSDLLIVNCEGEIKTITILRLTLSGLSDGPDKPDRYIDDVVIYDNGKTGFVFDFSNAKEAEDLYADYTDMESGLNSHVSKSFFPIVITVSVVFGVLIVTVIVVIIVLVTKESKKNKQAAATFQPFSAGSNSFTPPAGMDQTVQQSSNNNNNNDNFAPPPAN